MLENEMIAKELRFLIIVPLVFAGQGTLTEDTLSSFLRQIG